MSEKQEREIIFSPSILSADFGRLGEQLQEIAQGGAQYAHIDVMDGVFVPSISIGLPVVKSIRKDSALTFDVHLMITDPIRYIPQFADAGSDILTFHLEAAKDPEAVIDKIRECGCKCGIVINPETPVEEAFPYLDRVDQFLLMSVHPGFGGQKYIPSSTEKIRQARKYIDDHGLRCDLEVDGGVKKDNVRTVLDAGANVIVAGSAVFGGDARQNTKDFMEIFSQWQNG